MSVLITAKFQGDTAAFRQALTERAGEFEKIADGAASTPPGGRVSSGRPLSRGSGNGPTAPAMRPPS